jgi:hypothetical protein
VLDGFLTLGIGDSLLDRGEVIEPHEAVKRRLPRMLQGIDNVQRHRGNWVQNMMSLHFQGRVFIVLLRYSRDSKHERPPRYEEAEDTDLQGALGGKRSTDMKKKEGKGKEDFTKTTKLSRPHHAPEPQVGSPFGQEKGSAPKGVPFKIGLRGVGPPAAKPRSGWRGNSRECLSTSAR